MEKHKTQIQKVGDLVPSLSLTRVTLLGKLFDLSAPQLSHL